MAFASRAQATAAATKPCTMTIFGEDCTAGSTHHEGQGNDGQPDAVGDPVLGLLAHTVDVQRATALQEHVHVHGLRSIQSSDVQYVIALLENERALRLSSIQRHQERAMKSLEWCRGIMPAVERGACMPPPFRDTSMLVQQWQHRLGMGTEKWTCEWTRRQGRLVVGA
eukprot:1158208-Pelagomonas_calceolata.AAC.8